MAEEKHMTREEIKYLLLHINYHPLLTLKSKKHVVIIRVLKDDEGKLYGDKVLEYDLVIDGVTGPSFKTIRGLLKHMHSDPLLKYFYHEAWDKLRWLDGYI